MNTTELQRALNHFTTKYLHGVTPLRVDGKTGPATQKRIRLVKHYLGYLHPLNAEVTTAFRSRMWHPKSVRYSTPARIARGMARRRKQRRDSKANHAKAHAASGVVMFDGVPCAAWIARKLQWAREHGWPGRLVSGWRDPAYSESLCYGMCGRPSCPGRCAGRNSNHSGSVAPHGAADVTHYEEFGRVTARDPNSPRIFNALPIDPVHFSASGN